MSRSGKEYGTICTYFDEFIIFLFGLLLGVKLAYKSCRSVGRTVTLHIFAPIGALVISYANKYSMMSYIEKTRKEN